MIAGNVIVMSASVERDKKDEDNKNDNELRKMYSTMQKM